MKGFKDSTKTRSGFSFPSKFGFTGSTGRVQNISYTRRTPKHHYAEGGRVRDGALHGPTIANALDDEAGPERPLRPGFAKGGKWIKGAIKHPGAFKAKAKKAGMSTKAFAAKVTKPGSHASTQTKRQANLAKTLTSFHHAKGSRAPRYAKGGRIPDHKMEKIAHKVVGEHVARPAPQGHQGLGKLLKGNK